MRRFGRLFIWKKNGLQSVKPQNIFRFRSILCGVGMRRENFAQSGAREDIAIIFFWISSGFELTLTRSAKFGPPAISRQTFRRNITVSMRIGLTRALIVSP